MFRRIIQSVAAAAMAATAISAIPAPAAAIVSFNGPIGSPLYSNQFPQETDPWLEPRRYATFAYAPRGYASFAYAPVHAGALAYPVSNHLAWCIGRFRSYDPATDTYIGYDGFAHPCLAPF
jgi:hypothetical protein